MRRPEDHQRPSRGHHQRREDDPAADVLAVNDRAEHEREHGLEVDEQGPRYAAGAAEPPRQRDRREQGPGGGDGDQAGQVAGA